MARQRNGRWPRYVPVAEQREAAARKAKELKDKGNQLQPVNVTATTIASTFWGKAWCRHLEKFSDYSNRLPRGRSYVRNGSVIDLKIETGKIVALVGGSSIYRISIAITPLPAKTWAALKAHCAGSIGSALELLQGNISDNTMQAVCDRDSGLFPSPQEIDLSCDCPDWAALCKHLAAVLYGVGARLDESPELLFVLRGVDYQELIGAELAIEMNSTESELTENLSDIFGVDIDESISLDVAPLLTKSEGAKRKKAVLKKRKNKKKLALKERVALKKKLAFKKVPKRFTNKKMPTVSQSKSAVLAASEINISRGIRASHIKKLRKTQNLSVADLAKLTNKTVTTVSAWENRAGVLKLQSASQQSLEKIFSMTAAQIRKRLRK